MTAPTLIYEDPEFLAVYKPAGLLMHDIRGREGVEPTLAEWLAQKYPELRSVGDDPVLRPGIVHRLDRDVSGVLIVARTQESFAYFKGLFRDRRITKIYYALVVGIPHEDRGVIALPIGIRAGTVRRSVTARSMKRVQEAITEFRVLERFEGSEVSYALLEVLPHTGRTHQIRVHLAHHGYPIVGDGLYGGKRSAGRAGRPLLHAKALEFTSARGRRMRIEADLPNDFSSALAALRTGGGGQLST